MSRVELERGGRVLERVREAPLSNVERRAAGVGRRRRRLLDAPFKSYECGRRVVVADMLVG